MQKYLFLFLIFFMQLAFCASSLSAVGYWKTIDDITGKPKSIILISEAQDKTLYGKVLRIFPRPGYDQHERCTACTGSKHNQPIVGMIVLQHLKHHQTRVKEWTGGRILDPINGKEYRCNLRLIEDGRKLYIRGYIGIPLFGRSQLWVKVNNPNDVNLAENAFKNRIKMKSTS